MTDTLLLQHPSPTESISHVFELLSIGKTLISMQRQDSQQRKSGTILFEPETLTHGLA